MPGIKSSWNKTGKRRIILGWLLFIILVLSGCGAKPKVVGIISGLDALIGMADGFKDKMTELGYIEGKNIVYDLYKLNSDPVEQLKAARKLVAEKVDLIYAFPTEPAVAAKEAIQGTKIPLVFANATIEVADLVKSVRVPGGNITGVRFAGLDQVLKSFEIFHEMAPWAKRLYITYEPNYPNCPLALKGLRPLALSYGVTLVEAPVNSLEEIRANLQALSGKADIGIDAIQIMPEILTQSPPSWELITQFAAEHRLPVVGSALPSVENGAVFAYSSDPYDIGTLAAPMADKIFKGAPAGKISVITPETRLRINFKLAQKLGLIMSEELLSQAFEIIR